MKYRWNAKQRHGVHSPFIYELTDKCFRTPISIETKSKIEALTKRLRNNHDSISITDYGAGSKKLGNQRKISSIYKTSSSKGKFGKLLYQLVNHYQLENVLELGTSVGVGTIHLALGQSKANITTIEGCPETHRVATDNFKALEINNITAINSTFKDYLPNIPKETTFDLIFIDGHHDGDAMLEYMEMLFLHAHTDTFFILDDIRWSSSMKAAWKKVIADDRFHVTIDLFRMGIALLRPQQEKEHFVIRP